MLGYKLEKYFRCFLESWRHLLPCPSINPKWFWSVPIDLFLTFIKNQSQFISNYFRILEKVLEESDDSSEFRNIQGLVASYEFGRSMINPVEMCPKYFPCQNYENYETAHLCPGTKIGCALCGLSLPDTCGVVCPIAGFYCGKFLRRA